MGAFILGGGCLPSSPLGLGSLVDLARSMDSVRMVVMGLAGGQVGQGLGGVRGGVDQNAGRDGGSPSGKIFKFTLKQYPTISTIYEPQVLKVGHNSNCCFQLQLLTQFKLLLPVKMWH